MEKITGIGGFFFRGENPSLLHDWYERHLGLRKPAATYDAGSWWQETGPTVFGCDTAEQLTFAGKSHAWRINFRVRNLDAMVAQLTRAGIPVTIDPTTYPNGRFAHLEDPEGNDIELWEPAGADLNRPEND